MASCGIEEKMCPDCVMSFNEIWYLFTKDKKKLKQRDQFYFISQPYSIECKDGSVAA